MNDTVSKLKESREYLRGLSQITPDIGIILGSGLGSLADLVQAEARVPLKDVPHLGISPTVPGHKGLIHLGTLEGKRVMVMQGRIHYYEGHEMNQVIYPARLMKAMGASTLIVTAAAGAVNPKYRPGDIAILRDHINFMGLNPLRGPNIDEQGPRFLDMTQAYDPSLRKAARSCAVRLKMRVHESVYVAMWGPTYETPAEVRMVRRFGGDLVGMSTVPEVLAARHAGMRVLGIAMVTNMAAGLKEGEVSHEEVLETTTRTQDKFVHLLKEIVKSL